MANLDAVHERATRVDGSKDYEWVYEQATLFLVHDIYDLLAKIDADAELIAEKDKRIKELEKILVRYRTGPLR